MRPASLSVSVCFSVTPQGKEELFLRCMSGQLDLVARMHWWYGVHLRSFAEILEDLSGGRRTAVLCVKVDAQDPVGVWCSIIESLGQRAGWGLGSKFVSPSDWICATLPDGDMLREALDHGRTSTDRFQFDPAVRVITGVAGLQVLLDSRYKDPTGVVSVYRNCST